MKLGADRLVYAIGANELGKKGKTRVGGKLTLAANELSFNRSSTNSTSSALTRLNRSVIPCCCCLPLPLPLPLGPPGLSVPLPL